MSPFKARDLLIDLFRHLDEGHITAYVEMNPFYWSNHRTCA